MPTRTITHKSLEPEKVTPPTAEAAPASAPVAPAKPAAAPAVAAKPAPDVHPEESATVIKKFLPHGVQKVIDLLTTKRLSERQQQVILAACLAGTLGCFIIWALTILPLLWYAPSADTGWLPDQHKVQLGMWFVVYGTFFLLALIGFWLEQSRTDTHRFRRWLIFTTIPWTVAQIVGVVLLNSAYPEDGRFYNAILNAISLYGFAIYPAILLFVAYLCLRLLRVPSAPRS